MKKALFIIFIIFCVCQQNVWGQNRTIDSLNLVLKNTKFDIDKINILIELANTCEVKDNLKYANPIIQLSDKLLADTKDSVTKRKLLDARFKAVDFIVYYYNKTEGRNSLKILDAYNTHLNICLKYKDPIGIIECLLAIADDYNGRGDLMKRLNCLKQGEALMKTLNYKKGEARFIIKLAFFYSEYGDTTLAIKYVEKAEILEKEIGDSSRISRAYFTRARFYADIKQWGKAIKNFDIAEKIYKIANDTAQLLDIYYQLGYVYKNKYDLVNAHKYFNICLDLAKANKNNLEYIGVSKVGIGDVYCLEKEYDKAIENHQFVLEIYEYFNFESQVYFVSSHIANDYFLKKDYIKAKFYSSRLLRIANKNRYVPDLLNAEKLAYQVDSATNNYKDAFDHFQKYLFYKTKLSNDIVHQAAAKEKFQSDLEKQKLSSKAEQDKKDVLAKEEKQKQQLIIGSVAFVLLIVLIFSALLFKRFRLTNKQKGIIEHQKHIVEEKHKEITDSINYAERIQKTFLASNDLLNQHLHNYFILFKPKDVVSGDFYWADTLPNGNFVLATADSTGHGVPGAIMSLLNITSLEKAIEHLSDPAQILNHTRQTIIKRLKRDGSAEGGKDGMDCSLIIFDIKNKQLHIAAANNPVWIVRGNELIEIKPDKMPVGKHDRDQEGFTAHTIDINEGDIIYTLTDGFPDQFGGEKGKKFMSKNLKELLIANAHLPMQQQKELLDNTFNNWVGDLEQVDDVTLIGIKI